MDPCSLQQDKRIIQPQPQPPSNLSISLHDEMFVYSLHYYPPNIMPDCRCAHYQFSLFYKTGICIKDAHDFIFETLIIQESIAN